jgi:hypothetical protein
MALAPKVPRHLINRLVIYIHGGRSWSFDPALAAPDFDGVRDVVDGLPERVVEGDRTGVESGSADSSRSLT